MNVPAIEVFTNRPKLSEEYVVDELLRKVSDATMEEIEAAVTLYAGVLEETAARRAGDSEEVTRRTSRIALSVVSKSVQYSMPSRAYSCCC